MPEFDSTVEYRTIPLPGLEGYMVGSDGTVWSEWKKTRITGNRGTISFRSGEWHQLKTTPAGGKRKQRYLAFDVKGRTKYVHFCVVTAFIGPKPSPKHECRHLDGNHFNNRSDNLSWGTAGQNNHDRYKHGTMPYGERNKNNKLTSEQVRQIKLLRKSGMIYREIAAQFGVTKNAVRYICMGGWPHIQV